MQILALGFALSLGLSGCNGQGGGGTVPSLASLDRSCQQDLDCQVVVTLGCCVTPRAASASARPSA